MEGLIKATSARKRKKMAKIVKPEKPIFPDLYQENDLYFESRKEKRGKRAATLSEKRRSFKSTFAIELTMQSVKIKNIKPIAVASIVSKNLNLNLMKAS